MSTENGAASASTVIGLTAHPGSSSEGHLLRDDDAIAPSSPSLKDHTRRLSDADDTLPLNDFLKTLQHEMRRAERSRAVLSLVLYRIDDKKKQDPQDVDRLLEALHNGKRETDILGHVGDDTIAVLCPDTAEDGTQAFMRKIERHAVDSPFAAIAATYPDDLFVAIADGTRTEPALACFLSSGSTEHRPCGYPAKRCLDLVGALLAIGLLSPLMLAVAAAIALGSKGPIIFRQTRLGRGGVPFTFYKFRSMLVNGDDRIHREFVANLIDGRKAAAATATAGPAHYKLQRDPRITRIGGFIRRTSIDELPQLFNVLKGDMSLVGPRPPIPYETTHYQSWHLRRILAATPGITGLWQVNGRSRVTFNDMVRMDLRYIRECSLASDLKILLKTFAVVFRGDGAV